jgi:hypothetical protein
LEKDCWTYLTLNLHKHGWGPFLPLPSLHPLTTPFQGVYLLFWKTGVCNSHLENLLELGGCDLYNPSYCYSQGETITVVRNTTHNDAHIFVHLTKMIWRLLMYLSSYTQTCRWVWGQGTARKVAHLSLSPGQFPLIPRGPSRPAAVHCVVATDPAVWLSGKHGVSRGQRGTTLGLGFILCVLH